MIVVNNYYFLGLNLDVKIPIAIPIKPDKIKNQTE